MSAVTSPYAQLNALIGTVLDGRYRIEAMIGSGGMGAIFRARREGLERPVALKVLHPAVSSDPTTAKRFEREAYSVSKLDHPNIVRVSDYGTTADGMTYFAMELVEGTQLTSHLGQPMAPARAVDIIAQVLEGLDHAHSRKIVHRDLKPDNAIVRKDAEGKEHVTLVDFGIAKVLEDRKTQERLTQTGFVYGTPHYMSPEQATGSAVDHRADLYAVGLILYEMLAGYKAFRAQDPATMLRKQVTQAHDPLPADVPKPLAAVVDKLLEKSPDARFQGAREALDALAATRKRLEGVPAAKLGAAGADEVATRANPAAATLANNPSPPTVAAAGPDPSASTVGTRSAPADSEPTAVAARSSPSVRAGPRPGRTAQPSLLPWMVAGVAVLGLGTAVGYLLMDDSPTPTAAIAGNDDRADAGSTGGDRASAEQDDGSVTILIKTNVPANIVDAADGGIYGRTGEPLVVDKSESILQLVLRAEGYEDRSLQIKPNADKTFDQILREEKQHRAVVDLRDPWHREQAASEGTPTPDTDEEGAGGDEREPQPAPEPTPSPAPDQKAKPAPADPAGAAKSRGPQGKPLPAREKKHSGPDLSDPFKPG